MPYHQLISLEEETMPDTCMDDWQTILVPVVTNMALCPHLEKHIYSIKA